MVVGTVLAVLASAVLLLRPPSKKEDKMQSEMLRIGEQMKLYKQAASAGAAAAGSKGAPVARRGSVDEDPNFPGGRVAILFGSQTGTAEGFAEVLKKLGRKAGFAAHAIDLEEYDAPEQLPKEKMVILVMATYGEGDPTDNAVEFIKFLRNEDGTLDTRALDGVRFAVFGLGNRQYEHYNSMGRAVDRLMEEYGATRAYHYGEGDDDASLDEDFDDWRENLWKELRKQLVAGAEDEDSSAENTADAGEDADDGLSPPEYEYLVQEIRAPANPPTVSADVRVKASTKHFFTAKSAKVVVNREVRPSTENGSTVHLEFDLRDTGVEYLTADNLAILPENLPEHVQRLATRLGYDLDQWVAIEPVDEDTKGELPFPSPCTVEQILTCYLGINSAPRKGPLKQLAYFASSPEERAKLVHLSSKEGKDEYQQWVLDDERSYVDVLEHFASVKVPINALIHVIPFLAPRYYTISSSSLVNPQRVHATISVIESKKDDGRVFRGVCSTYSAGLLPLDSHADSKKKRDSRPGEQGSKAPRSWPSARVFVRPSTFRLPADPMTPIIMIGPGTGIAPMRAFLHERAQQQANGLVVGKSVLYFGCRRRDEDFIYRDELETFQETGVLSELHLAFSREQDKKVYVQHLLSENGAGVWDLIHKENAYIYVCGATTMGNDVNKVLHQIIEKFGGQSADEAAATLKALQDGHRYIQELWA